MKAHFLTCVVREGIQPKQAILHSDNSSSMKGANMLLQRIGVVESFSRPAVRTDNPCLKILFKTSKYRPKKLLKPFADLTMVAPIGHVFGAMVQPQTSLQRLTKGLIRPLFMMA
jgi:hypothetical protein